MISRDELIKLIVEYAMEYIEKDYTSPDVGWGMPSMTAIELAEKKVLLESARWNSLAALSLDFDEIRAEVMNEVTSARLTFRW